MKQPSSLKKGDCIALVAPARKVSPDDIHTAVVLFEKQGFRVKHPEGLFAEENQFAGNDKQRSEAFQQMLDDDKVKALVAVRGGYGSVRIIDKIDFSHFAEEPKWIVGYSDLTVFHNHVNRNLKVETLHASMPVNFSANSATSLENLFTVLQGGSPEYEVENHRFNRSGTAQGLLCGGNLSVLYSLLGSKSFPVTKGKILFIEDLDEYLYHIDRMMQALKRAGVFKGLKGMIVGAMSDMNDNDIPFGKTAYEIIHESVSEYNFPVCFGFPAGHINDNRPLVMGRQLTMEVGDRVRLRFKKKAPHIRLGKRGEALAEEFLREKGYKILETNWRHDRDEIDIIARDGSDLVIVEVKTRSGNEYGEPDEAVDAQKESYLSRAAEAYCEEQKLDVDTRFDIISILIKGKKTSINHMIDAFYPE